MANRKTRPTSPGRRFGTYPAARAAHRDRAREGPHRGRQEVRRAQLLRARHQPPPRRRRQAPLPPHRLQAPQGRRPGEGGGDRVRPQPQLLHRAAALRRRRQELHPRPPAAHGRRPGAVRRGRRHPARQRAAAARIPTGTVVHNVELVPGQGGRLGRAAGTAIQVVPRRAPMVEPAPALDGGAHGARRVPGDGRLALQPRAPEHQARQGRPQPPQGPPPADPRRGDEPRRPSARRRRGPPHARRAPGDPLGQADARLPNPQEGQDFEPLHRAAARRGKRKGKG